MFNKRTPDSFSKIFSTKDFPIGVELVSTRGYLGGDSSKKVLSFAEDLKDHQEIDWVSITDNAGGHPRMAPLALGMPILYGGKEVIIHLTGKDLNRHALESQLWLLASHGFHNVLALTGDHPGKIPHGRAKPVFDLDSIGILALMETMNQGSALGDKHTTQCNPTTQFEGGCTVNPHKPESIERHLQYLKLENKILNGASYVIPQIGFNLDDLRELRTWMDQRPNEKVPLIGNVFVPSPMVLKLFADGKIPGVHLNQSTYQKMMAKSSTMDSESPFLYYSALWMIALKHIGYDGCYLGGLHNKRQLDALLNIYSSLQNEDVFPELNSWISEEPPQPPVKPSLVEQARLSINESVHDLAFSKGSILAKGLSKICQNPSPTSPLYRSFHTIEKLSKGLAFDCKDCGECLLPQTAYICPESGCAKQLRNGPCGGSGDGKCEVRDHECLWSKAYRGMKHLNRENELLTTKPTLLDHDLRGTSGWINHWKQLKHPINEETTCQSQLLPS